MLQARENLMEAIQAFLKEYDQIPPKEKKEQTAKGSSQYWKPPIFYDDDDDDDEESSFHLRDIISELSLVKELNLTPSESEDLSEDLSDNESECDVPVCNDSSPNFTTFSNPLFDSNDDSTSKSLLNRDTSVVSSPKFDSLLEEFSGELAHIDLSSPRIDEADFDPEEEIRLVKKLVYDNSSPRPPKELNSDAVIESFSSSPIPVEGSNSLMEEIDIFLAPDESIPPGIENDDSEGDILEELLNNDSLSLPENESFHFDYYYDPSSPRPPTKPLDDDGIYFDAEPDTRILTAKVVDDISERYVLKPRILATQPSLSLCPMIDTLLSFSFENEDKVINTDHFLTFLKPDDDLWSGHSYLGCSISPFLSSLTSSSMGDRVRLKTKLTKITASIAPYYEDSRARGFVLRSLELQSLAWLWESKILNLID
ncbi:hypothetical protein Tco_1329871 [Tanacetum coccineum]